MSIKMRSIAVVVSSLLLTSFVFAADGSMRDITTRQLVNEMGLEINLGNTFEATGDWIEGTTVADYETAWNSPVITRDMIRGYKTAGIKTVRVPVAWSNLMTGDAIKNNQTNGAYTISPLLMARVKEVVDWIIAEDMYAIINIHWDGGWWDKFPTDSTECMRKYKRVWEQIGNEFKDYGDHLLFASLNEEGGWDDIWYIWRNADDLTAKARSYGILNTINQTFVNDIRAQGGNNAHRHLQVQGYHTDIDRTVDEMFVVPTDPRTGGARIAVSVHYYDPFGFTHLVADESWAQLRTTWGTAEDIAQLNTQLDKLVTRFVSQGVPVIIGEYGVASWDANFTGRTPEQVRNYTLAVTEAIRSRGMLPVLWCVQLGANQPKFYYDRHTASFVDPEFAAGMLAIAEELTSSVRDNRISGVQNSQLTRPNISVRGRMLNVSSPNNSALSIRLIDTRGRASARFNTTGNGNFSLTKIPAGKYFVDVRGAGVKQTLPVVVK